MQGTILSFDSENNKGLISGHDGVRYSFTRMDWESSKIEPKENLNVDFDTKDKKALEIIVIKSKKQKGKKSRPNAIFWALFGGGLGAHKFYLGQNGMGILYLLFCWTAIPLLLALIEVIFLAFLNSDEFDKRYND
jgi:TM2 domain-containing membrane protein YozV